MKDLAQNRRARADYAITDTLEAGIVLTGAETKSAKTGGLTLTGSYARVQQNELYLINAHIRPYAFAPSEGYDPVRTRKLLVHRREIVRLQNKTDEKGLTLIPLSAHTKKGRVKILLGLGRAKKKFDKRETIKKREAQRSIKRALNQRR